MALFVLVAAACGDSSEEGASDDGEPAATDNDSTETPASDDDDGDDTTEPAPTDDSDADGQEPTDDGGTDDGNSDDGEGTDGDEPPADDDDGTDDDDNGDGDGDEPAASGDGYDFSLLDAPTGEPIVIGYVNTEGPAGLNFPELEEAARGSVDYLNEHGGLGGRPIDFQTCISDSSPESSQACAQELAGKNVEMVWLGLDLFPDYATYDAAGIPVVGVLPLFAGDYASNALYMNGGNATLAAANVYVAVEKYDAKSVAIISADNAGANSSEAATIAALDTAGIPYRSIQGAESETDAGAQALVAEALSEDPDVLISLYGDAGCIGMIRGRAALGSDVPVLAAGTCANGEVVDVVGDDAFGWNYIPGGEQPDSVENAAVREAVSGMAGVAPDDVLLSELGLGRLAPIVVFSTARGAQDLLADGGEITGAAIADHIRENPNGNLNAFPDGGILDCGAVEAYAAVCTQSLYLGEYAGDGKIQIAEGFEQFDVSNYLAS